MAHLLHLLVRLTTDLRLVAQSRAYMLSMLYTGRHALHGKADNYFCTGVPRVGCEWHLEKEVCNVVLCCRLVL